MPEQKRTKQKKQGRKPQRFETLQSERLNSVQCRAAGEQLENQDEIPNQIGLLLRAHFQLSWLRLYFWCSYTAHYSSRLPPPWGCFCQWGLGGALGLWWWEYGGTLVGTMMVGNPTSSLSQSYNPPPVVFVFQAVYIMLYRNLVSSEIFTSQVIIVAGLWTFDPDKWALL